MLAARRRPASAFPVSKAMTEDNTTDIDSEQDRLEPPRTETPAADWLGDTPDTPTASGGDDDDDDDGSWQDSLPVAPITAAAVGIGVLFVLMSVLVVLYAPFMWTVAYFATIAGLVPGVLLFPWVTSPFGPGLLFLDEPFARIHFTISQFIRRAGVLVKRASNDYELGTYLPETNEVLLSDRRLPVDDEKLSWGLFGKRKFGVTWEFGTDLHRRITPADESMLTDGGGERTVNVAAGHRYFRGSNDADVISRTEEAAEAEYGGGEELSTTVMGLLVGLMLFLGSMTTWLML